jgi:hypothetical protein
MPEGYNCEPLNDDYQVRWQVDVNQQEIALKLVANIPDGSYMGFGVSGESLARGSNSPKVKEMQRTTNKFDHYSPSRGSNNQSTAAAATSRKKGKGTGPDNPRSN